eukprot:SAG31_NODE_1922_length_6916_cov_3.724219_1_plen_534_part_00
MHEVIHTSHTLQYKQCHPTSEREPHSDATVGLSTAVGQCLHDWDELKDNAPDKWPEHETQTTWHAISGIVLGLLSAWARFNQHWAEVHEGASALKRLALTSKLIPEALDPGSRSAWLTRATLDALATTVDMLSPLPSPNSPTLLCTQCEWNRPSAMSSLRSPPPESLGSPATQMCPRCAERPHCDSRGSCHKLRQAWSAWWQHTEVIHHRQHLPSVKDQLGVFKNKLSKLCLKAWKTKRTASFVRDGRVIMPKEASMGPRPGCGNGSVAQLNRLTQDATEEFRPRGSVHPLFLAVLDRPVGAELDTNGWRYWVKPFSALSPAARQYASTDPHHSAVFGFPQVMDGRVHESGSPPHWWVNESGERIRRQCHMTDKTYRTPLQTPGCYTRDWRQPHLREHGPQLDANSRPYVESDNPGLEYRQWRSLQPAPWLPDGLFDDVLSPVSFDSDEWQHEMSKPLSTAPGASQVQVGVLRFTPESVQRLVLEQVNQFLLTGSVPKRLKYGKIWKLGLPCKTGEGTCVTSKKRPSTHVPIH